MPRGAGPFQVPVPACTGREERGHFSYPRARRFSAADVRRQQWPCAARRSQLRCFAHICAIWLKLSEPHPRVHVTAALRRQRSSCAVAVSAAMPVTSVRSCKSREIGSDHHTVGVWLRGVPLRNSWMAGDVAAGFVWPAGIRDATQHASRPLRPRFAAGLAHWYLLAAPCRSSPWTCLRDGAAGKRRPCPSKPPPGTRRGSC